MKKKIVSDWCLRCGRERKSREKSNGCYVYGDLMSKNHLYTYEENTIDIKNKSKMLIALQDLVLEHSDAGLISIGMQKECKKFMKELEQIYLSEEIVCKKMERLKTPKKATS